MFEFNVVGKILQVVFFLLCRVLSESNVTSKSQLIAAETDEIKIYLATE